MGLVLGGLVRRPLAPDLGQEVCCALVTDPYATLQPSKASRVRSSTRASV